MRNRLTRLAKRLLRRLFRYYLRVHPSSVLGRFTQLTLYLPDGRQRLWIGLDPAVLKPVLRAAPSSRYGKFDRLGGSIIYGGLALKHAPPRGDLQPPLRCLFVGYGHDTYDAQLLANLGWKIEATFLDVLDWQADARWRVLIGNPNVRQATYCQWDARRLSEKFAPGMFDWISISRASVDLMPASDFLHVVHQCYRLLSPKGNALVTVNAVYFDESVMNIVDRNLWLGEPLAKIEFHSHLGEFALSVLDHPKYLPQRLWDGAIDAHMVIQAEIGDLVRVERNFGLFQAMLDGRKPDTDVLQKLSTCNGRFGRILALDELPGEVCVGAFDIVRRTSADDADHWAFVVRTTLVISRPN